MRGQMEILRELGSKRRRGRLTPIAHRERPAQLDRGQAQLLDRKLPVKQQHLGGRRGGDARVAIPVAADPRTERQPPPRRADPRIVEGQRPLQIPLQPWDRLIEDDVQIPKSGAGLIRHLRARGPAAVGEPERSDFAFDRFQVDQGSVHLRFGPAAPPQEGPQPRKLCKQGPPLRLGGMRRENKLHPQPVDQPLHFLRTDPARLELNHRGLDRFADRARLAQDAQRPAPAQQHDPEILLGQVHQLEIKREGHRLVERHRRIEGRDHRSQAAFRTGLPRPPGLGEPPERFHPFKGFPSPRFG